MDDDVKKTVYDELIIKVNTIDTKILNTSGLATKTEWFGQTGSWKQDLRCWQKLT